jgi:hypothetical protein
MKTRAFVALGMVIGSIGTASAADLFVSTAGDDTHAGTTGSPFKTIAHCASVALPGDTCRIAGGEYAELVRPPKSGVSGKPITFAPASTSGSSVVLSGRKRITGWTKHAGSIWKASVPGATFEDLFVDGARMVIARSPNLVGGDVYRPTFNVTGADGGTSYLVDPTHLTQGAGYWDGAKLFLVAGLGWSADTVAVSKWDATAHRIDFTPEIGFKCCYTADKYSRYYLYDKLALLDAPSEWFLDRAAGVVYLWSPDSSDPSTHVVEQAATTAGFDLDGRSDITVQGLTIASGQLVLTNATRCRIDGVRIFYGPWVAGTGFGAGGQVIVSGSDNEIVHSEIAYAPGRCVYLGGTKNALRSSHVHHCDARGTYEQIVQVAGKQNVVEDCSLHDTGRDGIGTTGTGTIDGSLIQHNELFDTGLIAKDCGAFYTYETDGGGTVLRYNVVHGVRPAPTEAYGGVTLGMGIYFDDGCSGFVAHHNVVYDIGHNGIFLHQPSRSILVYNNTTVSTGGGFANALETAPGGGGPDATGSVLANNLTVLLDDRSGWCTSIKGATPDYHHNGYFQSSGKGRTNSLAVEATGVVGDPRFTDAAKYDFTLLAGSPMIDKGATIASITDGFSGTSPDIGAFERGGTERPGPRGPVGPPPPTTSDAGADAETGPIADSGAPDATSSDSAPSTGDGSMTDATDDTAPDGSSADSSGSCGCRVVAGRNPRASIAFALLAAAAVLARRRRMAPSTRRSLD